MTDLPDNMTIIATCFELAMDCPSCNAASLTCSGRLAWCHVCGWYGDAPGLDGIDANDIRDPRGDPLDLEAGVS